MFVQSHIQRNQRQNSNNKPQAQHQQHQYLSDSVRSASVGNSGRSNLKQAKQTINHQTKARNLSNRRISRDFSIDIPNGANLGSSAGLNYCNDNINSNNVINNINFCDQHRANCPSFNSNHNLERYYNLAEVDSNDALDEENEESLIVQLNDSFEIERCRLKSVDSFANPASSLTPNYRNQSLQFDVEYDDLSSRTNYKKLYLNEEAEKFEKYSDGNGAEFNFEANSVSAPNELDCGQVNAMIANSISDNDDYQDVNLNDEIDETESNKLSTDFGGEQTLIKKTIDIEERENSLTGRQQFISRSSIIACSRKNFELVSSFCRNFITYQLETWRLLAGCANNCGHPIISSPINEIYPQRSICSICHIVQTNVPKPPPRGKVYDSEEAELELNNSFDCNNNSLPEFKRLSSSQSEQTRERKEKEEAAEEAAIMIDRTNYTPYVGPRPILYRALTSDSQRIPQNVNHLVGSNYAYLQYNGNHFNANEAHSLVYQNNFSQRTQAPLSYANQVNYRVSNPTSERLSSIEKQNFVMRANDEGGGGSSFFNEKRYAPIRHPQLYRASTGIELRNESTSRAQGDNFFSPNQQLLDYRHHHYHHHNHNYNHHQCLHRRLTQDYQTKTANFAPSSSESFDLSLDEKYPIPAPFNDTWNQIRPQKNHIFNQQQIISETKSISSRTDWSQNSNIAKTGQNFDAIRSTTFSSSSSREPERDLYRKREKDLVNESKKKTGSDSELCSIKREQVSQQSEASIRRPSTSKPPSIEKIHQDANQIEKLNFNLSARDDSRTVSPNSVDSSKLLTVGFSRLSKRISPSKFGLAGARRRLWLKQKGLSSLSVQRSEEVAPVDAHHLVRQMTTNSLTDSGTESGSCRISKSHIVCDPRACFVEGLGQGQIASRQALVSPYLGDIQISLSDQRGMLEVEVVRARRLRAKPGANILPSPFVKVYLMKEKKCIAKFKTNTISHTLDPLYQEKFIFRYDYENCVLQVIVWGDYGRKDRKSLMGISQIQLGELEISKLVIDWYQLFNAPSMASSFVSSKALRQTMLMKEEPR